MNTQNYNVNLRVGVGIAPKVRMSQGDVGRELAFNIYDGVARFSPPSSAVVKIKGTKPSGLGFNVACVLSGNVASVLTTLDMTQEGGAFPVELEISNGNTVIGTANFAFYIEPSPHPAGTTDGTTEEARTVLAQCEAYAEAAQEAAEASEEVIQEAVDSWLEEHPEAVAAIPDNSITEAKMSANAVSTAKLQDGAVTEAKFSDALKLKTVNGYVTPQMYGAKADNTTDDTTAIQSAVNSGQAVFFPKGTYLISGSIELYNLSEFVLNAENAVIHYTGTSYAFKIRALRYSTLKFDKITADNGGCIYFDGSLHDYWSQYDNIYFTSFLASESSDCVRAEQADTCWINEIRWHNGRMTRGICGFRLIRNTENNNMSHWNFYNIGIEGVTTGFSFESPTNVGTNKAIGNILFVGCRFEEGFTTLISSTGRVRSVTFIECSAFPFEKVTVDSSANNWAVYNMDATYTKLINGVWVSESRHSALEGGTPIVSGSDLNDILEVGSYYCNTNSIASGLSNCPVTKAFILKVENRTGAASSSSYRYRRQILTAFDTSITYERVIESSNSGSSWTYGSWVSDGWEDISSALTYDNNVVTSGTFTLLYNAKLKMVSISGNVTASLLTGSNKIATISDDYRTKAYYHVLSALLGTDGKTYWCRVYNRKEIYVRTDTDISESLCISGMWVVY